MVRRPGIKKSRHSCYRFPISSFPEEVIFQILNKMTADELVEMRQTCSLVNSVAEAYAKQLASRPALGVTQLCFVIHDPGTWGRSKTFELDFNGDRKEFVEEDLYKRIAGISIDMIAVAENNHLYTRSQELERRRPYAQLLKIFEHIQPVCNSIYMPKCPFDLIIPFTNCITFLEEFDGFDFRQYLQLTNMDTILETLNTARKRSMFCVYIEEYGKITEGIFDKMKHFSKARLSTNVNGLREFLHDIQNSTEKFALKRICLYFDKGQHVFDMMPPLSFVRLLPKPKWCKTKEYCLWEVRLMSLPSQFLVIEEGIPIDKHSHHRVYLICYFIEKTQSALYEKLRSIFLRADDSDSEDSSEEDEDEEVDRVKTSRSERHMSFESDLRSIVSSIIQ